MVGHRDLAGLFAPHVFGACMAKLAPCPYGQPGDRLWVRETWYCDDFSAGDHKAACSGCVGCQHTDADRIEEWRKELYFRADGEPYFDNAEGKGFWRPSIFMPRWASRITLELTEVRVERLQDISNVDAMHEGADGALLSQLGVSDAGLSPEVDLYRTAFKHLWFSINGADSWALNPWVWVLSFRKLASETGQSEKQQREAR